jgi:hypothetical protein
MRKLSAQNTLLLPVIATGVALFALIWVAALAPKNAESRKAHNAVIKQEQRLDKARKQVVAYTASRKRFEGMLVELRRLDLAVPARADISGLLREVQVRARLRDSDLRLATLKSDAAATGSAQPVTPGATAGPGGLSALQFTFAYTGRYFNMLKVLHAVRDAVTVQSGNLSIDGRLLTIDGVTFQRPDATSKLTKVVLNATAYVAADSAKPPAPDGAASKDATAKAGT